MLSKIPNPTDLNIYSHELATPGDPGAGLALDWPCPIRARVRITTIRFLYTTLNANRFPLIQIVPTAGAIHTFTASSLDPGALSTRVFIFSTGTLTPFDYAPTPMLILPLPTNIILEPGDTFRITAPIVDATIEIQTVELSFDQWIIA